MNRKGGSKPVLLLGIVVVAVVAGFAVRAARERAARTATIPARPDLARWPAVFRTRVEAAEARLAEDTREVAALGELARLYHANGFLREAEQAYRGLLRYDPAEARWPHLLAALLAGYGQLDEAVRLEQRAIELAPDYLPGRLRLGDALWKANQREAAEAAYGEALQRAPEDPYALLGLARVDLASERLTAAREKLTRAAAANPGFFGAQSLLATVFERLGNDAGAAVARARASEAGRYREARDPWLEELTDYCYDVYRLQVAAATMKAAGDLRGAATILERALSFAPDDVRTLRQLGNCRRELAELAAAKAHLEKAVRLAPAEPGAYLDLVEVFLASKETAAVFRTLETGLERCAEKAGLHHQLGVALLGTQRPAEAVPHLEAAVGLSPENPDPARELITTLFGLGREAEAAAVLETALDRFPEFPAILVLGVRERLARGDADGAARLMTRVERAGATPGDLAMLAREFRRKFGREPDERKVDR